MASITRITAVIRTGSNGTQNGCRVYLGICGREFRLDRTPPDGIELPATIDRTYIFSSGTNVVNARLNNPTSPQLNSKDLDRFPVYIRCVPVSLGDHWILKGANVTVAFAGGGMVYQGLVGYPDIMLVNPNITVACRGLNLPRKGRFDCTLRRGGFNISRNRWKQGKSVQLFWWLSLVLGLKY
jgi:hypothetical protein